MRFHDGTVKTAHWARTQGVTMTARELERRKAAFEETAERMTRIRTDEFESEEDQRREAIMLSELHLRNTDALLEALHSPQAQRQYERAGLDEAVKEIELGRSETLEGLSLLRG